VIIELLIEDKKVYKKGKKEIRKDFIFADMLKDFKP